jgi:asparagine synthase (glutamine-hydrolysing)
MATKIRHRGPDWSGIYSDDKAILAHERLSIVDVEHGAQPLFDKQNGNVLAVNGEIYNHMQIRKELQRAHDWQPKSDCESSSTYYDEYGPKKCLKHAKRHVAFILYDKAKGLFFVA